MDTCSRVSSQPWAVQEGSGMEGHEGRSKNVGDPAPDMPGAGNGGEVGYCVQRSKKADDENWACFTNGARAAGPWLG